jgi:predicted DNA-binding ribbon-helix-helix protein
MTDDKKLSPSHSILKNILVGSRRTSIRLESYIWDALYDICAREQRSIQDICTEIAHDPNGHRSLTSAVRLYVLNYFRKIATEERHANAGHGSELKRSSRHGNADCIVPCLQGATIN